MKNYLKRIQSIFNPELYHGWGKSRRFFEGWYYKLISEDGKSALAVIPGVAMDKNGIRQAFIQILNGKTKTSEYLKFDYEDFIAHNSPFKIRIKNNLFKLDEILLDLPFIKGNLKFSKQVPWPTSIRSPGIMGPYSFVPFMECYHGILSLNHDISGEINLNGKTMDFTGGKGYMEKDWGKSFPSAYTWMQTNHFMEDDVSFKASVANIPWLSSSFTGFIAGLWINGRLFQFTTYNSTKLKKCFIDKERVELEFANKHFVLKVEAQRCDSTELSSPILGLMDGKIEESMCSEISVKLIDKKNNIIIFDDKGKNAALEVAGNIPEIQT